VPPARSIPVDGPTSSLARSVTQRVESRRGPDRSGRASAAADPRRILALQRTVGNRAVQRILQRDGITALGPRAAPRSRQLDRAVLARQPSDENVCDDPTYCTPFATAAEAASEEAWMRTWALPTLRGKFGSEVHDLWESYLSRRPGDSLAPRIFETAGNPIEESFAMSWATLDDVDAALDMVLGRLNRFPGGTLRPYATTMLALSNFLSAAEMDNRQINYDNPLSKAGNIAGQIGRSDAGPDYRKILGGSVTMTKYPLIGNSGYIDFALTAHYEVFDAIDFCPGQCGSIAEKQLTVPMSRLEASGEAYDVPFIVRFTPEKRTNREFYADFPI
jgi:hypothetical protein